MGKNWKTKEHMGLANTNVLPMEMLWGMEHSNADRCMTGTYGCLCLNFCRRSSEGGG